MPLLCYVEKKFSSRSLVLIDKCNEIIADYVRQRFKLSLRQLYYQLVSRNIVENTEQSYKRVGDLVNNARLAGLIDWDAIEDRGRNLQQHSHWSSPQEIITAARRSFLLDKWENQPYRPEVWVEKAALEGVVSAACEPLDVPYFACRGYNSQSEEWTAAMRLKKHEKNGQTPIIFYLGDHDPSGIDMTRDHIERLEMFMGGVEVVRIALNMDQVNQYKPPPNPAKEVDSRYKEYLAKYGDESWELDALEPQVLANLITDHILSVRVEELYRETIQQEEDQIALLKQVEIKWRAIAKKLKDGEIL
ncbi:MAG TPA: hypothetical protein P5317_07735 [Myxococcota bacterium]|nr:hypothetical protein [Myxococcota bacterium]HRV17885.1 hypothetical protein [Myxococcota bacterium]